MTAMTSESIRTASLNTSPVGEHSGKRTSDLTAVQDFYGVIPLERPDAKRLLWTGQPEIELD